MVFAAAECPPRCSSITYYLWCNSPANCLLLCKFVSLCLWFSLGLIWTQFPCNNSFWSILSPLIAASNRILFLQICLCSQRCACRTCLIFWKYSSAIQLFDYWLNLQRYNYQWSRSTALPLWFHPICKRDNQSECAGHLWKSNYLDLADLT